MSKTRFIIIGIFLLVLVTVIQVYFARQPNNSNKTDHNNIITGEMRIGGPFTLIDENGQAVTDQDFAGQYKLMYFGFSFCPDICPIELQKMAEVYDSLTSEEQEKLSMLFVTVDPARDTPQQLKDYTDLFHTELIGLTGSLEQIEAIENTYKIYQSKVFTDNDKDDYLVDHSSYIYLMSPSDDFLALYKMQTSPAEISENVKTYIQ